MNRSCCTAFHHAAHRFACGSRAAPRWVGPASPSSPPVAFGPGGRPAWRVTRHVMLLSMIKINAAQPSCAVPDVGYPHGPLPPQLDCREGNTRPGHTCRCTCRWQQLRPTAAHSLWHGLLFANCTINIALFSLHTSRRPAILPMIAMGCSHLSTCGKNAGSAPI